MSYYNLIQDALDYFDKCRERTYKTLKEISSINWTVDDNNFKNNTIQFLDNNKNIVHEFYYEFIGSYYKNYDTWIWGWAYPTNPKKTISLIKQVLNYGINIEFPKEEINEDILLLKNALINSRIKLNNNEMQYEILIAIVLYLTKTLYIFQNVSAPFLQQSFYILMPKTN